MDKTDMDIVTYTIVKGINATSKVPNAVPNAEALDLGTVVARIRDNAGKQCKLRSRIVCPTDNWQRGTITLPRKGSKGYELAVAAKADFADWRTRLEHICLILPSRTLDNVKTALAATAAMGTKEVTGLSADQLGKMLQLSDGAQSMASVLRDYATTGTAKHHNKQAPLAPATRKIVMTLAAAFDRYEATHGNVTLATISAGTMQSFQDFLTNEEPQTRGRKRASDTRSANSVSAMMGKLRTALKYIAKKHGISLPHDIFADLMVQEYRQEPIYLNTDELTKLAAYRCDKAAHEAVRRAFVFQALTGMRFGDLSTLQSICRDNEGNPYVHYIANKTGEEAKVPLTELAIEQLNPTGRILEVPSLPTYNAIIKEVMAAAGINRNVPIIDGKTIKYEPIHLHGSSHMARRTFVGRLINNNISAEVVRSMSGHAEGSKAFARYYSITDDQKRKALSQV